MSDTERRYSQTEKEALAILWACERFHAYLYGAEFELMTDHKPLECIFSPKSKTCARIERLLLRMQPYKFSVKYIPGPKNIADSLSRLLHPTSNLKEKSQTDEYVKWVAQESTPVALTTREIESASEEDPELHSSELRPGSRAVFAPPQNVRNSWNSRGSLRVVIETLFSPRVSERKFAKGFRHFELLLI